MSNQDFWNDKDKDKAKAKADERIARLSLLKSDISDFDTISQKLSDLRELTELLKSSYDKDLTSEVETNIINLKKEIEKIEITAMLSGKYDASNCILEIHSGAGGTEACDWAMMLYRMYSRWCERKKYKLEILDQQFGEETGIKSISILVKGKNAYGYLKNEKGIHRLVRLSPFDSNNRRHTSFASVDIIPEIDNTNLKIQINEKDLKIDIYRSSGAGGQHVNTTDSAVRITHLPTKIVVTCQSQRSQIQNKERALEMLKSKLLILQEEKNSKDINDLKGEQKNIEFGSQIRSYVMHPYSMVKDHRTNVETSNVSKVLDGEIDEFIESNIWREKNV